MSADFALKLAADATRLKDGDDALDRLANKAEETERRTQGATAKITKEWTAVAFNIGDASQKGTTAAGGLGDATEKFTRDAAGRLRDASGKFVKTAGDADVIGRKFSGLSALISGSATKIVADLGAMAAAYLSWQTIATATTKALDFNRAVSETSTLIEGTPEQLDQISDAARRMAMAYGQDAAGEVRGFYEALSAGAGSIADAQDIVDVATRAAVGGVTQTATAVDILTSALNVYKKEGLTAIDASDALFVGVVAGKTTFEELAAAMGRVLPMAQTLGLSLDETTAAVAALTAGGIQTSEAVTGVRAVLTSVLNPSLESAKLAKQLGIDFSEGALRAKGFGAFMTEIAQKTGGSATAIQTLFGSVEATTTALAFGGEAGRFYGDVMDQMATKAGTTDAAFRKLNDGLGGRFDVAFQKLQDVLLSLGDMVLPIVVGGFEALSGAARAVWSVLEAVTAAVPGLGLAWQGVGQILSGIGTILNGVADTVTWLTDQIIAPAAQWWGSLLLDAAASVGEFIASFTPQPVIDFFTGIWDYGVAAAKKIGDLIGAAQNLGERLGITGTVFGLLKDVAVEALGKIGAGFTYVGQMGKAAALTFAAAFLERINNIIGNFQIMTEKIADGLNTLFKTNTFRGVGLGQIQMDLNATRLGLVGMAEDASAAADSAAAAFTAPMESVGRINLLLTETATSAVGAGIDLEGMGTAGTEAGDEIAGALGSAGKAAKATKDKIDEMTKALNGAAVKAADDLAGAFADFVTSGFKSFSDFTKGIRDSFRSLLSDLIKTSIANPIKIAMGMTQDAKTGAWSVNPDSALGKVTSGIGAFTSGLAGGFTGVFDGFLTGGLKGAFGSLSTSIAGATTGLAGLAGAIGAIAAPIAAVAAIFSFFKKKTELLDSGLKVMVDGADIIAKTFETIRTTRFWGLSKKTRTTEKNVDSETAAVIANAIGQVQQGVLDAAGSLGVGQNVFDGFNFNMQVSTKGMSQEQALQAIQAKFAEMGDAFAAMIPELEGFRKPGEGAATALSRLAASAQAVNAMTDTLGLSFKAIGLAGADLASDLVDQFGSIDAMSSAWSTFYRSFYSDAEQLDTLTRQTSAAMDKLGLAMPSTAAEYRALVEAQDLSTEAGRANFAALVGLSGAMSEILDTTNGFQGALEATRKTLRSYIEDLTGTASELISPAMALASAQGAYDRALAATAAGEDGAASDLTQAATAMLAATRDTAGSAIEIARAQAMVIAQLSAVAGGGLVSTSGSTVSSALASETVAQSAPLQTTTTTPAPDPIEGVRTELSGLRELIARIGADTITYNKRSADMAQKWDKDGMPPVRT